jgi:hypothetical protein
VLDNNEAVLRREGFQYFPGRFSVEFEEKFRSGYLKGKKKKRRKEEKNKIIDERGIRKDCRSTTCVCVCYVCVREKVQNLFI